MHRGKVNKVELIWEGTTARQRELQSCLERINHLIEPSLIGLIWQALSSGLLSQQRRRSSFNGKALALFFLLLPAWTDEGKKKRNACGIIFNLDMLLAAFHLWNEPSQRGLLVEWKQSTVAAPLISNMWRNVRKRWNVRKCWIVAHRHLQHGVFHVTLGDN